MILPIHPPLVFFLFILLQSLQFFHRRVSLLSAYCSLGLGSSSPKYSQDFFCCCYSVAKLCPALCDPGNCGTPGFPVLHCISWSLLRLMSIESVMPSNHLILCHPLLCLPSIFPSIRVFSNELALCIRWPKVWSFSFSVNPSNEYSGLISFRLDWLDLLSVQGTPKSLLQHHS